MPDGVVVNAAANATGLLYGAVTLWQLIATAAAQDGASPCPRWRSRMRRASPGADSCSTRRATSSRRSSSSSFIDWMALHKLNVLHWHLTDDQAWRLEIRKYPKLTQVGALARAGGRGPAGRHRPGHRQAPALRRLTTRRRRCAASCAYAAERGITIVPEIEMPGHAQRRIAAYPRALGVAGIRRPRCPPTGASTTTSYNVEESTFAFLEDVLAR